jgi:hypothetical protein
LLNETNMPNLISTLLGAGGFAVILVAIINQVFGRAKTRAEAKKNEAEAEKTKAETSKLLNELGLNSSSLTDRSLKELKGWIKAGSDPRDYEIGVDQKETYHCKFSAYIKSRKESPRGFGTLMQIFMATAYAGKRLKMSGSAKSEGVEDWAGFWLRVDGPDKKSLSFDNMQDGPLRERRLGQNLKSCWTFQIIASILHSECY